MAAWLPLLKRYALPLTLFSLSIIFQLIVVPSTFPPSHYDVLGVRQFSSIQEVTEAYEKLTEKWNTNVEIPLTYDFVKIRYAFELLTNPLWKRDYDAFGTDENLHILENMIAQFKKGSFSELTIPLLNASSSDPADYALSSFSVEDLKSTKNSTVTWIVQVYSSGSAQCTQFLNSWRRVVSLLDGVARTSATELGELQLAAFFAERRKTGQPFFRNGLPSIVALPPGCRSSHCIVRYQGDLWVDAVVDWAATDILGLPRIFYYTKDTLGPRFIAKSGPHKVKVIIFSKSGERAPPFLSQAARDYRSYASFAFVLWQEEESSLWWNTFEVESAPAIVFVKDPGVKPVVYHGTFNSSWFSEVMELHKQQELPQLRRLTSMELGCDARGYSRAGNDTVTWYCVIVVGRPGFELNKIRETIRRVQDKLVNVGINAAANEDSSSLLSLAADTFKQQRLTFAWVDGEAQKKYCFFYLNSEDSFETCGPRRYGDLSDTPRVFIVRYKRDPTKVGELANKTKSIWDSYQEEDANLASQLVAKYNGSMNTPEIIRWISQIIKDGDSRDLPYFTSKTPELIDENEEAVWSKGANNILSTSKGMKHRILKLITDISDHLRDPRIGPALMLGACISFGTIWMQKSSTQPTEKPKTGANKRHRRPVPSIHERPQSITDVEPKDARQLLSSGSDSD
ncbi:hypothetical protein H6P81_011331 [Aristolochia fimbriata]|uniref:J domain-containing protein n=1 Tax=Aristolochia fimbriata TaxID=158543 RepID=A0AAV7EUP0_ARIFI|nr:hypothetical protein H6P81_011331 [Aristolochia fimbriata]